MIGIRLARGQYFVYLYFFSFQLFVILEESSQHHQPVRRHLRSLAVAVEFRIFGSDRNDLVIFLA